MEKEHLDWENHHPILAMHVRHGDACPKKESRRHDRTCTDMSGYMQEALLLQKRFGYRAIYLATDDSTTVEAAKQYPQFKWLMSNATNAQKVFAADTSPFEDQVRA